MSNSTSTTNTVVKSSFPVLGLLGSVLVVLKLLGYIHISWLFVLMPFYIGLAIVVVIILGILIFAGGAFLVAAVLDAWGAYRSRAKRLKK